MTIQSSNLSIQFFSEAVSSSFNSTWLIVLLRFHHTDHGVPSSNFSFVDITNTILGGGIHSGP